MQSVTGRTFTRLPLTSRYQGKPTSTDCMNGKGAPPCVAHFHSVGLGCLSGQISVLSHTITYALPIPIYTTSGLSLLIDDTRPHILRAQSGSTTFKLPLSSIQVQPFSCLTRLLQQSASPCSTIFTQMWSFSKKGPVLYVS